VLLGVCECPANFSSKDNSVQASLFLKPASYMKLSTRGSTSFYECVPIMHPILANCFARCTLTTHPMKNHYQKQHAEAKESFMLRNTFSISVYEEMLFSTDFM